MNFILLMSSICLTGMQVLLDAREKLDISWGSNGREQDANDAKSMECNAIEAATFVEFAPLIKRLWQDRGIRRAYERRREFQIVSVTRVQNPVN